jgi:5-carboxymethyl-2-hydroxymuconic-semialdehyde dehydrogenase
MIKHWINGREVESKDTFINYNPATGEAIGEVASGGAEEVAQAVAAAKEAFPKWANTPAKERARLMRKLGELIEQNVPHLAELETLDTGLPIHQTKNVLIPRASHNFDFFAEVCTRMDGHSYPVDDQMLNYTLYQPVGVCALVSPWNVPFMTATWKTAPCLALGQHGGTEDVRAVAADRQRTGTPGVGSRDPQGRAQRDPGLRRHRR